jgi:hypothetical protein
LGFSGYILMSIFSDVGFRNVRVFKRNMPTKLPS